MNTWIQITSGRGPAECGRAVYLGTNHILDKLKKMGANAELLQSEKNVEKDSLKSAIISLNGKQSDDIKTYVQGWAGTIKWVCQSPYRPSHRRKNWFFSVELFTPPETITFSEKDIRVESFRASGPGGQHVNCTDSAIRVTHIPTGFSTTASEERSQHMNRRLALARLDRMIECANTNKSKENKQECWQNHNDLERGNSVKVFKGANFQK